MHFTCEEFDVLLLELENEHQFYNWCEKYIDRCIMDYFKNEVCRHRYRGRKLSEGQWYRLFDYFQERWGKPSGRGRFDSSRRQHESTLRTEQIARANADGQVNSLSNADFHSIEQRVAAHLIAEGHPSLLEEKRQLKEIPVSKLSFNNVVFLNGKPVSEYTDEQIYSAIKAEEARIESLEKIQTKPKRLQAEIESAKKGLTDLVTYLDSK
jgi:hypothetical protein